MVSGIELSKWPGIKSLEMVPGIETLGNGARRWASGCPKLRQVDPENGRRWTRFRAK
jgi:hypothetical protein